MIKVLFIEDSEAVWREFTEFFNDGSINIEVAEAAPEAAELLKTKTYDLIILDYHLPGMTGMDLLRSLKDEGRGVKAPIIMLTSEMEERGTEIKDLNVVSWLVKPVEPIRLKHMIPKAIAHHKSSNKA